MRKFTSFFFILSCLAIFGSYAKDLSSDNPSIQFDCPCKGKGKGGK